jgi:hypothetical protein
MLHRALVSNAQMSNAGLCVNVLPKKENRRISVFTTAMRVPESVLHSALNHPRDTGALAHTCLWEYSSVRTIPGCRAHREHSL